MKMREEDVQIALAVVMRGAGQTEVANAGPRVEDEALAAGGFDFDAGSVAADAEVLGGGSGHRAARAPDAHFHRRDGRLRRHASIHCFSACFFALAQIYLWILAASASARADVAGS